MTRRLCTIAGFYRYAVEEELLDHSSAAHVRRPRPDYESHATGLDRNELGGLLVAAGRLGQPAEQCPRGTGDAADLYRRADRRRPAAPAQPANGLTAHLGARTPRLHRIPTNQSWSNTRTRLVGRSAAQAGPGDRAVASVAADTCAGSPRPRLGGQAAAAAARGSRS